MGKQILFLAVMALFSSLVLAWQTDPLTHASNMMEGLRQVIEGEKMADVTKSEAVSIYNDIRAMFQLKPYRDCSNERILDWNAYCVIMHSQGLEIDCDNANAQAKSEILGIIAQSEQSYQYGCMNA